jgi:formate dehydrogenase subunit gamma
MPEASAWNAERAKEIIAEHAGLEGPMLPILHALQEEFGCVSAAAVPLIADALNLTRAEVHGVVTFYHFFRTKPAGKQTLYLCRAEACQSMGARALEEYARRKLKIETMSDQRNQVRRALKAAWWAATPWRIPARLRFIRERDAASSTVGGAATTLSAS